MRSALHAHVQRVMHAMAMHAMRTCRRGMVLAFGLFACGSDIPHPRAATQPPGAFVEVDYPPPPARPEFVSAQPANEARWVNGEWQWTGSRWAWKQGAWIKPPANAAFAKASLRRSADGKLLFAPGTWRNERGEELRLGDSDRSKDGGAPIGANGDMATSDSAEVPSDADRAQESFDAGLERRAIDAAWVDARSE